MADRYFRVEVVVTDEDTGEQFDAVEVVHGINKEEVDEILIELIDNFDAE